MKTQRRVPYRHRRSRPTALVGLRVPAAADEQAGTYVTDPLGSGLRSPQLGLSAMVAHASAAIPNLPLTIPFTDRYGGQIHSSAPNSRLKFPPTAWRNLSPHEDQYLNWVSMARAALADLSFNARFRSAFVQLNTAKIVTLRIFEGEVKAIYGKEALVTMTETERPEAEPLIGTCDADTLAQNHIGIGDRFRFVIRRSNGGITAVFEKYSRGIVDQAEVQRIQRKFSEVAMDAS